VNSFNEEGEGRSGQDRERGKKIGIFVKSDYIYNKIIKRIFK